MSNLLSTVITCQTLAAPSAVPNNEYHGNRGLNLIVDQVATSTSNLATAAPSSQAQSSFLNQAFYQFNRSIAVTIWFQGWINPMRDSIYEFTINTNGNAVLLIGTSSTNSTIVATNTNSGTVFLQSGSL
jgi:hypothetical protein